MPHLKDAHENSTGFISAFIIAFFPTMPELQIVRQTDRQPDKQTDR